MNNKASALNKCKRMRGRPAAPLDSEVVNIVMQPHHKSVFYRLGKGNVSLGVRIAAELLEGRE